MLATRTLAAAAGAGALVAVTFTGSAGDSSDLTSYSISVDCGDGGDMVVATFCQGVAGLPTVSSWTLDGQTITSKANEDDGSETSIAIGTCSGVSSGTNTFAVTWSNGALRCIVFVWKVENCDLSTMQQAVSADAISVTFSAFSSNTVVIAACGTATTNVFSGATGITYDGNELHEVNMTGGHDLSADASTTVSFTGTANRPVIVGLELKAAA